MRATIFWPSRTTSRRWRRTSGPPSARPFPPREGLRRATEDDRAEVRGKSHGRVEARKIRTTTRLTGYLDWPGAKQVCLLERTRRIKGKTTLETVCAVTSLGPERASAEQLLAISRGHWDIENACHWCLDVTFEEDQSRVRERPLRENFAWLNRLALSLLKQHPGRQSLAMKRRSCGWSDEFSARLMRNEEVYAAGAKA